MRHTNLEDSEVFNNFVKIAAKEGLLNKEMELLYPDYDISAKDYQLDIGLAAMATRESGLYGLKQESLESLVNQAHPGGGTTTELSLKPAGDLAKVENVVEQHKKNQDVALKKPTGKYADLATKLVALAGKFEDAGFLSMAKDIDSCLNKIAYDYDYAAETPASAGNMDISAEELSDYVSKNPAGGNIADEPGEFTDPRKALLSGVQRKVNIIREQQGLAPVEVSGQMDASFSAALKELRIDMKSYPTMDSLNAKIESVFQAVTKKPADKSKSLESQHKEVQTLINAVRAKSGKSPISVSGKFDSEFAEAMKDLGIEVGSYKTWVELKNLITSAGKNISEHENYNLPSEQNAASREMQVETPGRFVSQPDYRGPRRTIPIR